MICWNRIVRVPTNNGQAFMYNKKLYVIKNFGVTCRSIQNGRFNKMKKSNSPTVIIKTKKGSLHELTRKKLIYKLKKFHISADTMIHNTDGVWRPISGTRGFRTLCLHIKSRTSEHDEVKASELNEEAPNNSPKLDNSFEALAEINDENHRTLQNIHSTINTITPAIAIDIITYANEVLPNNSNQNSSPKICKRKNYFIPQIILKNESSERKMTKPNHSKYIAFFCIILTVISPAYWIAIDKIIVNDEFAETRPKNEASLFISGKPLFGNSANKTETTKSWGICKKMYDQELLSYKNSAN